MLLPASPSSLLPCLYLAAFRKLLQRHLHPQPLWFHTLLFCLPTQDTPEVLGWGGVGARAAGFLTQLICWWPHCPDPQKGRFPGKALARPGAGRWGVPEGSSGGWRLPPAPHWPLDRADPGPYWRRGLRPETQGKGGASSRTSPGSPQTERLFMFAPLSPQPPQAPSHHRDDANQPRSARQAATQARVRGCTLESSPEPSEEGMDNIPILQMGKRRHREV